MIDFLSSTINNQLYTYKKENVPTDIVKEYSSRFDRSKLFVYKMTDFTSVFMACYSSQGTMFYYNAPYSTDKSSYYSASKRLLFPLPSDGPYHKHNLYEITYAAKGDFTYVISGREVTIREGDFILMDMNCVHFDRNKAEDTLLIFAGLSIPTFTDFATKVGISASFSQLLLSNLDNSQRYIIYKSPRDNYAAESETLLANMLVEEHSKKYMYEEIIKALSCRLLQHIDKYYIKEPITVGKNAEQDALLIDIGNYIQKNLQTITTNDLEKEFHYNRSYFNRLMKAKVGITLTEYIQRRRLDEAKRLLLNTSLPTSKIIEIVGYKNSQYFYKLFSENTGMTPAQYRSNNT